MNEKRLQKAVNFLKDKDVQLFNDIQEIQDKLEPISEALKNLNLTKVDYVQGRQGDPGLHAPPVDEQRIIDSVTSQIPIPKDGIDGKDGKDALSPDPSLIALEASKIAVDEIKPQIPTIDAIEKDLPKLGTSIRDGLELLKDDERLDISAVKGLDNLKDFATQGNLDRAVSILDNRTSFLINKINNLPATTAAGTGTVTSVSVTTANGVSGSVATATTTPAITLTLGAITPTSVNSVVLSGSSTPTLAVTGTTTVSGANTGDQSLTAYTLGAASSTDNAITRFDGTTGKTIQNSGVIIDDNGRISNGNATPTYGFEFTPSSGIVAAQTVLIQDATATTGKTYVSILKGAGNVSNDTLMGIDNNATSFRFGGVNFAAQWGVNNSTALMNNSGFGVASTVQIGFGSGLVSSPVGDVNISRISAGVLGIGLTAQGQTTGSLYLTNLGATGTRVTKGWFTDVESTNMPTVGGTAILTSLTAPQFTTIELGNASDTTLSRSAGGVLAVEGVVIPSISSTNTITNKRNTKRVVTTTQSATPTINTDNTDVSAITGLAQAITSFTTNLSGTPVAGDTLIIEITDNGTARAITWGASFEASTVALPTTTVISSLLTVGFRWNTTTSKWRCVAVA